MYTYWIGSTKIEVNDINEFRDVVEEFQNVLSGEQAEYSNKISDLLFAVEADYQNYHGLDEHCWDVVHHKN